MEQYKTCSKCNANLPSSQFFKQARAKDGLSPWCKLCQCSYHAKYRANNRDRINGYNARRKDANAEYQKLYYIQNKKAINEQNKKWAANNKERKAEADRNWVKLNKDKVAASAKRYYLRHPEKISKVRHERRARLRKASLFQVTIKDLKKIMQKPCIYCGKKAEQLDHIIPLSRGGQHSVGNLAPACKPCNLSKNNKLVSEWKLWKTKMEL